jgi:hypothetical protein
VHLRRIRIRCVHHVTKVLGAAEGAVRGSPHDLPSLSSELDSLRLDRHSKLAKTALSIQQIPLGRVPSSSDLVDPPKLPPSPSAVH